MRIRSCAIKQLRTFQPFVGTRQATASSVSAALQPAGSEKSAGIVSSA
jgi:hypothetical protein